MSMTSKPKRINATFCADPEDWERLVSMCPKNGVSRVLRALIRRYLRTDTTIDVVLKELEQDE